MKSQYEKMLSDDTPSRPYGNSPRNIAIPTPKPSSATPQKGTTLKTEASMAKAGSMPNIPETMRSSRRDWEIYRSRIGKYHLLGGLILLFGLTPWVGSCSYLVSLLGWARFYIFTA